MKKIGKKFINQPCQALGAIHAQQYSSGYGFILKHIKKLW